MGEGFHVFPVWGCVDGCDCRNPKCKDVGKHPLGALVPNGLRDATTDPEVIRRWWKAYPGANIGIRTGACSGFWVLDVDPHKDGTDSLFNLLNGRPLPDTAETITGGRGRHILFRHPGPDKQVRTTVGSFGPDFPGLDVRGDGGYIVAPPSLHHSFNRYEWEATSDLFDGVVIEPAPDWLMELLIVADEKRGSGQRSVDISAVVAEGGRNAHLFKVGASLRGRGMEYPAILGALAETNRQHCNPPLDDHEVERIARSAANYEANAVPSPTSPSPKPQTDDQPQLIPDVIERQLRELPMIEINNRELRDVTQDALWALINGNSPEQIFVRSGELVQVIFDEKGRASFRRLEGAVLRGALTDNANWRRTTKSGRNQVSPPTDVVDNLATLTPWEGIPSISGLSQCPVVGRDGTSRMSPGYHSSADYYVATKRIWPTWEGDGSSAAKWLMEDVLIDFPFEDQASRANCLALMLLPFVRPLIGGLTPFHLIDAPAQGTGKSLLGRIALIPGLGANIAMTTIPKDEENWRKTITSALRDGLPAVFLDNISRKVDSEALASVLTTELWMDRLLSTNQIIKAPNLAVWLGTSNNAELSLDITRRTVYIRLNAGVEIPSDRTGFKHSDIAGYVTENRHKIGSALIGMALEWTSCGMPEGTEILGTYENWAKTIGGILASCDVSGFIANKEILRDRATSDEAPWHEFIPAWWEKFADAWVTSADLYHQFGSSEFLDAIIPTRDQDEKKRTHSLGKCLGYKIDRIFEGFRISIPPVLTKKKGTRRFKLSPSGGIEGIDTQNLTYTRSNINTHVTGVENSPSNPSIPPDQVQTDLWSGEEGKAIPPDDGEPGAGEVII